MPNPGDFLSPEALLTSHFWKLGVSGQSVSGEQRALGTPATSGARLDLQLPIQVTLLSTFGHKP